MLFDQKLLKKFTPLPFSRKTFLFTLRIALNTIVTLWQFFLGFRFFGDKKGRKLYGKISASSINSVNGARSCKVNCTISNGFLMISFPLHPHTASLFSFIEMIMKSSHIICLTHKKIPFCGFFTSFSLKQHIMKLPAAHFLALINFFFVSTLASPNIVCKCFSRSGRTSSQNSKNTED